MKRRQPTALAAALLALAAGLAADGAERVFKWVDEQGVTHYSQTPPPGVEATPVEIAGGGRGPEGDPLARYRRILSPPGKSGQEGGKGTEGGGIDPAREAEARARNCKMARERLAILTARSRILVLKPDGSSERLTEEQRQAEIRRMREIIAANCKE